MIFLKYFPQKFRIITSIALHKKEEMHDKSYALHIIKMFEVTLKLQKEIFITCFLSAVLSFVKNKSRLTRCQV